MSLAPFPVKKGFEDPMGQGKQLIAGHELSATGALGPLNP